MRADSYAKKQNPTEQEQAQFLRRQQKWRKHVDAAMEAYQHYRNTAISSRTEYNTLIADAIAQQNSRQVDGRVMLPRTVQHNWRDINLVLCMDAAMNRRYPNWGLSSQPNAEYYATKLKLFIMGIYNETTCHGKNYLWNDEGGPADGEKVVDLLISYLSDPDNHLGAKRLHVVFDNCSVNKNAMVCFACICVVSDAFFCEC